MWCTDIEKDTSQNKYWRKVLFTSQNMQVVLMSVPPGEELGWEVHRSPKTDQFFRVEAGRGVVQIGRKKGVVDDECELEDGVATVVKGGKWHNVINESRNRHLKFYTIYSPPHHPPKTLHKTKDDEE